MKRTQKIAFIALISTSSIMILSYTLLAFFRFYFQFQNKNQSLTRECQSSPGHDYFIQRFNITEWVTLIIAAVAMVLQLIAFIMVCNGSKNKSIWTEKTYSYGDEAEVTNDQLKKRDTDAQEIESNFNQTSIFRNKTNNRILSINFHIIIVFGLFIGTGANVGHMVKGIISLEELSECTANSGQELRTMFENYIILSALIGYSFISVVIRVIILTIDKFSQKKSYLVSIEQNKVRQQMAIQTSQNALSLNEKCKRKSGDCRPNQISKYSKVQGEKNAFQMPKLKLGKYFENADQK